MLKMELESDTGESLLQLEIRKCQQAFAMSTNDEPEEFEDIEFFHRIPPVALTSFKIGPTGDFMRTGFMTSSDGSEGEGEDGYQDSEGSYMFQDNVMEYGEPQFFPGNCVGYLETILEETDEDCEEEEGSSCRHWWTPDSDTDTESVIRLDPSTTSTKNSNVPAFSLGCVDPYHEVNENDFLHDTNPFKRKVLTESTSSPSSPPCPSFTSSASTKPFEIEDLYLLDQLDLAFEETLMKPRRRTGFAFEADLDLPLLPDESVVPIDQEDDTKDQLIIESPDDVVDEVTLEETIDEEESNVALEDDEEPAVVNEEDFFCSSSDEDNSGPMEISDTSQDSSSSSSSSDSGSDEEDKKSDKILAEFSMHTFNPNDCGEMYKNNHAHPHRRSFEGPSKIRSFRSYDSLNSLLPTELLFSSPETFSTVPFEQLDETVENASGLSSASDSRSCSTEDKEVASRKNSGEASSENLSEDSGVHDLLVLPCQETSHQGRPEFALNPFIYSSDSGDNSMMSYSYSNVSSSVEVNHIDQGIVSEGDIETSSTSHLTTQASESEESGGTNEGTISPTQYTRANNNQLATEEETSVVVNISEAKCGLIIESGPMSTLESSWSNGKSDKLCKSANLSSEVEPTGEMKSKGDYYYEGELNSLLLLLPLPLAPGQRVRREARGLLEDSTEITTTPDSHQVVGTKASKPSNRPSPRVTEEFNQAYHHNNTTGSKNELKYPIYQNLPEYHPWTIPTILNECQSSNFGGAIPVQHRSPEEPEDSDYVTLVRKENENGNFVQFPYSVGVSTWDREVAKRVWDVKSQEAQFLEQHQLPLRIGEENMQVSTPSSSSAGGVPIPIKTYGGALNNDVQVYLVSSGSSRTPSPTVTTPQLPDLPECASTGSLKTKSVHFCPVVSEISWRESYAEPSLDDGDPEFSDHLIHANEIAYQNQEECHEHFEREIEPIEIVHAHMSDPFIGNSMTEKERLMALEPTEDSPPPSHGTPLSTVPDLVSQCITTALPGEVGHDEVDASTQLPSNGTPQGRPYYYQQQIFPAMFVATAKETPEVNHVNFKKNGKKPTYVAPPKPIIPITNPVPMTNPPKPSRNFAGKRSGDKDGGSDKQESKSSKPGFFQRLTKIRLSGNKNKQSKPKIFPKEIEHLNTSNSKEGVASGPILKKGSSTPLVLQDNLTPQLQSPTLPKPQDECSEAFENILEEIAGLNTILQRQQFSSTTSSSASSSDGKRLFAERKQFLHTEPDSGRSSTLESKLSQFKEEASRTRDQISKSHPDLEIIEDVTTRRGMGSGSSPGGLEETTFRKDETSPGGRGNSSNEREWYRLLRSAAEKYYNGGRRGDEGTGLTTGIVETDLDTGTSRELLDAELVVLDEIGLSLEPPPLPTSLPPATNGAKAQSLTNLTTGLKLSIAPDQTSNGIDQETEERAKSLEFLLDEENKNAASPPENKLQLDNRQLSEHELRIQRSLQKLNVPEWYRRHSYRSKSVERDRADLRKDTPLISSTGVTALQLLKRNDYGSSGGLAGGWAGLSTYRAPSLSSLPNGGLNTGSLNRSNFVRGRPATMSVTRSSKESLLSPSSTGSHSPSAFERSSFTYGMPLTMTRFGKGRLSSTSGTSPASGSSPSTPAQSSTLSAYKQPYLGWRSQERLNAGQSSTPGLSTVPSNGLKLSAYRPPAERLAADILSRQKKAPTRPTGSDRPPLPKWPTRGGSEKSKRMSIPQESIAEDIYLTNELTRTISPSVHDSIKEVTDAISQYVTNGDENVPEPHLRQKYVKKQALWFESSFVGKKSQTQ